MRKLIYKAVYGVLDFWRKVARKNGLPEQAKECLRLIARLERYKMAMEHKGVW